MATVTNPDRQRTSRLEIAQLTGTAAQAMIALQFATSAMLAIWTIGDVSNPALVFVALAILAVMCIVMVLDRGPRLSLPVTIGVLIGGPAMAALLYANTIPGYSQWFIGAATLTLFYLSLRGRILLAWVGFVLLSLVIIGIDIAAFEEFLPAVAALARQAAVLLVGTLFAFGLRRTGNQLERITAQATARASTEAANHAAAAERTRRLAQLEEFAAPLLRRLANGETLTDLDRREFAVAEASLRDSVRAAKLSRPDVAAAARAARLRGLDVVLLDDSGDAVLTDAELDRASAAVVETLAGARDGRVTARLLPSGRDIVATIVADGSGYVKVEVPRGPEPQKAPAESSSQGVSAGAFGNDAEA